MTYFTQFAASVGCQEYLLVVIVGNLLKRNENERFPSGTLRSKWCWPNLKLWARDVFTGVETRVLSGQNAADENVVIVNGGNRSWAEMAVDDNAPLVMRVLRVARLARLEGNSWQVLNQILTYMWKSSGKNDSIDLLE